MSDELLFGDVDVDEDDGPAVRIVEERPPLREGKVFLDYGKRATISENLEAAYVALNQAFRGIWIEKCLEHGRVREYWDEGDIDEVETLTLEARTAVEQAWRALSDVVDAHTAQCEAEYPAEGATDLAPALGQPKPEPEVAHGDPLPDGASCLANVDRWTPVPCVGGGRSPAQASSLASPSRSGRSRGVVKVAATKCHQQHLRSSSGVAANCGDAF